MFDFVKCRKQSEDIRKAELEKIEEFKARFRRYKDLIDNNSMGYNNIQVARYLSSIIVEYLNYKEAIQALEFEYKTQDNSLIEEIYRKVEWDLCLKHNVTLIEKIHDDDRNYYQSVEISDERPLCIEINDLPILLNPWKGTRIIDNMININKENVFDGDKFSFNVQNHYLYPMDIVVCQGANHSQFSARFKNQGKTLIKEVHNYSNLYHEIEFEGVNYVKKSDKSVIELEYDRELIFYSGIIFEFGRYILDENYHSLPFTQNKFK